MNGSHQNNESTGLIIRDEAAEGRGASDIIGMGGSLNGRSGTLSSRPFGQGSSDQQALPKRQSRLERLEATVAGHGVSKVDSLQSFAARERFLLFGLLVECGRMALSRCSELARTSTSEVTRKAEGASTKKLCWERLCEQSCNSKLVTSWDTPALHVSSFRLHSMRLQKVPSPC